MGQKSRTKKRRLEDRRNHEGCEQTIISRNDEREAVSGPSLVKKKWLFAGALVAAVFLAYLPAWQDGFIWDDDAYVTGNNTLHDLNGLERIWFDRHANPQYYPLVHTTFWVECHLWGLKPLGYHFVNIALHAANVILLWLVLRRLNVPGAIWAASLFAVHPIMVESVAWVTERKNVLSTFFYLCSFSALLRFWSPEQEQPQSEGRWRFYVLALLLFAAALCSKTVACSLPAAFLLVRWWKHGRLTWRDAWVTAPFFAIGLVMAMNTAVLEKHQVGASGKEWDFSALDRVLIAGRALWFYVATLAWPAQLTFIYPRWQINAWTWWQYLFPLAALGAIAALWALRGRLGRGPLTAALFFAGTLVPALGFFNVYPMRYSFVADHFQYLASVGMLALVGAAIELFRLRFAANLSRSIAAASGLVLVVLAALTWRQVGVYKDVETLWNDTLVKNPSCWMAHNNLGNALADRGQVDAAIAHYRTTLEIKPDHFEAEHNLGFALVRNGKIGEAIPHFRKALQMKPDYFEAHNKLGAALSESDQVDEAIAHFQQALAIKPNSFETRYYLGLAMFRSGRIEEAIAQYREALAINPDSFEVHYNLGNALAEADRKKAGRGQFEEAIAHLQKALAIKPEDFGAQFNLGTALAARGEFDKAIVHFQKALEIRPDHAAAQYNLAFAHYQLGSALAGPGQLGEALEHYRKALALARLRNNQVLADEIRAKMRLVGGGD